MEQNNSFEWHLPFLNSLSSAGEVLTRLSESSLFTFSAKDIKTKKYFIHNQLCANIYGVTNTGLIGMDSRECLMHISSSICQEDTLKQWEAQEEQAAVRRHTQHKVIKILDINGFVRVREHLTMPINGYNREIVGTAAVCFDRTHHLSLLHLLKQYQKYYSKNQATFFVSKYLKLDTFLQKDLTPGELHALLALTQEPKHKRAAHLLSIFRRKFISSITISNYVDNVKSKLIPSVDLDDILGYLRSFNQLSLDAQLSID